MTDAYDIEIPAIIGVLFSDKIVYNIVEIDGEFENTGMSVINFLKSDKNKFISKIFESQSYDNIKIVLDEDLYFGNFYSKDYINIDKFNDFMKIANGQNGFNYIYLYDVFEDLLLIKTINMKTLIAVDYKNDNDINNFINNIKTGEFYGKF